MEKDKGHPNFFAYFCILAAGCLWGSVGVFVTELNKLGVDAGTISFLRVAFAFVLSLIIAIIQSGAGSLRITWKTLLFCALLGIVCHGIYNIFYSRAVTMAGVSVSAVLLNVAPIVTMFSSAALFRERVTGNKILAVAINIAGCILTVTGGNFTAAAFSIVGVLFGVGAGICYAMTAIFGRLASYDGNPFVVSTYSYLFAALFLLLSTDPVPEMRVMSGSAYMVAFAYALIPTTIGYFLYYAGVKRIRESSRVPVLASVETIVAALFGICLYHEALGLVSILGIVLVIGSILLMNRKERTSSCLNKNGRV